MHVTKIAIVGTGFVGSTTAFACMMSNITAEILLVDVEETVCAGQVLDLSDVLSFSSTSNVKKATFKEAAQADIIVITAGKAQKPGQSRSELLMANKEILKSIVTALGPIASTSVVIIVTNPVDALTWYAQQLITLPAKQIIGSGTMLDSQRLRNLIAGRLQIAEESIHLYILGEHGDSQVASLSAATVGSLPIIDLLPLSELEKLAAQSCKRAYDIIDCKGYTNFGVASCVAAICENIIFNTHRVVPISCFIKEYGVCMSMPVVLGSSGVRQVLTPTLSSAERIALQQSVQIIKGAISQLQ